ncbi:unnamed protein product [Porites lobata]|uniref:Uncharacterized protein n=1 Tax=Porites lobata TaxID=104759 RepID=A0ABN8QNC0_9CNID|nr:unnamed protein product [Porites lobata]
MTNSLKEKKASILYKLFRTLVTWNHKRKQPWSDQYVRELFSKRNCSTILTDTFRVQNPTVEEKDFPIAYSIQVYKGAALLQKLLSAIYMPHNVYCIHIDQKSSETFRRAVIKMTKCLPNVFITTKTVNVIYYHISLLEAQLNCMHDLLQSKTQWKYLINLVGQDYPLYENKEIVKALKGFLGYNIIESGELPKGQDTRVRYSYDFVKQFNGFEHSAYLPRRARLKPQPPNNITILKGSTFTSLTREFCKYLLNDSLPKRLLSWLGDTLAPEESFYSSLQQVKGVPGGYHGNQSEWIMRAIHWETNDETVKCYGKWLRSVCVIDFPDFVWVFGRNNRRKLFVQKLPFNFDERVHDCLDLGKKKRFYDTFIYQL